MRKGTIIIKKKGGASIKPEDGKELSVPKEFMFDAYKPTSGKRRLACEFEGNPITKILIEGQEVPKSQEVVAQKANAKKQALQREAEAAKQEEAARAKKRAQKMGTWREDSFNAHESRLPADTKALLNDIDNFHLKLNKAARFIQKRGDVITDKDKFVFFRNDDAHKFTIQPNFGNFNFAQNCQKHLALAKGLCAEAKPYPMGVDGRLVVGLGQASVYETSITLHHVYGIPYIPASSIKGVVRNWVIRTLCLQTTNNKESHDAKTDNVGEKLALKDKQFCDVFGCGDESFYKEARQGQITFFDAFPCAEPTLEVDIMNPHYSDYYGDDTPPADYLNPTPIPFLTVGRQAAGAQPTPLKFQFVLGIRQNSAANQELLAQAATWLKQALAQQGIGAKTAVGYGYME
ncbi:type III-B CRISPR module RAMP protein Cmr6 [Microscilla marina]|uniref:Crispr-associated ramp protein, Cmr6 family, putative n=1 Tax=Microscilla marina ATCC 23134 TaxID=313606 RepID=A1ZP50_MICM2|nr:type III-B CRISPR module RAMP protein Cmr6 [Microscilla marina]EAY27842.1 crispr-associated ramp protein, Cmr6 family, putative [Microscilla marina ATCC 23134]